ncbi:MAG: dUTP diphosphatase [Alphaproteobacteria bacterium]|nr:dUTP diphosphatase [Alphaproteobacteria bacterium]
MFKIKIEYLPSYKKEWERLNYKHTGDAGFDLRAAIEEPITLQPNEFKLISTGIKMEMIPDKTLPFNFEMQIRPRSGLAAKFGIGIINSPGTVDFFYRGEIKTPLINLSNQPFTINPGERIAQAVICPVIQAVIEETSKVEENTDRGSGGFGSTGTK